MSHLGRSSLYLSGFLVGGLLIVGAQEGNRRTDLPPSAFESFAKQSTAKVLWSKVIGRLPAPEISVTVNAIAVEDNGATRRMMRGVRLDLARTGTPGGCDWVYDAWTIMCNRASTAAYVTEEQLEGVRNSLRRGAAAIPACDQISQSTSGLIVCGYELRNSSAAELVTLLTRAIEELKEAPR